MTAPQSARPLAGVRVVDFTANMAGPLATQILGDQGADVIKVEPPGGDVSRSVGNGTDGYSSFFANLNRSKRSITLDLGHSLARDVLEPLLSGADVVVHSFRPDAARRFGLAADEVRAERPRLVHVTITGFGTVGPYAGRPAYDHVIQAIAGFAAAQADPNIGEPTLVRHGVIDKLVGQTAAQAITAALFDRTRTDEGREVEIRMLDAAIAFLWPDAMMNHTAVEPTVLRPSIERSFRLTRTTDGHLAFVVVTTRQFQRLAQAVIGCADGVNLDRVALLRATARRLRELNTSEAVEFLARFDVPAAPVLSLEDVHRHAQVRASQAIASFEHPVLGHVRQANPVPRFDGITVPALLPAPKLGENTLEVALELGLADEVTALAEAGVFGRQPSRRL